AHQVRMIAERNAEQVEHLALMPVGRAPHAEHGVDFRIRAAHFAFDADALVSFYGVQMIDDLEAGLVRMPVDGGQPAEANIFLFILEIAAQVDDLRRVRNMGRFAEGFDGFQNGGMTHRSALFRATSCGSSPDQSSTPFLYT